MIALISEDKIRRNKKRKIKNKKRRVMSDTFLHGGKIEISYFKIK